MLLSRKAMASWITAATLWVGWAMTATVWAQPTTQPTNEPPSTPAPTASATSEVSTDTLSAIVRCATRQIHRYTRKVLLPVAAGNRGVKVNKTLLGMFRGGFQSLTRYLKIVECIGRRQGLSFRYSDRHLRSLTEWANLPIFARKQGSQRWSNLINYYNPAWIRWATKHLIPRPKERIAGVLAKTLYTQVFQRFVQVTAYTHAFLKKGNRWNTLLQTYKKSNWNGKLRIRRQLRPLVRDGYGPKNKGEESYYYHAGHAALFWMRRAMDNTADETWAFFRKVLALYDPAFLAKLKRSSLGRTKLLFKSLTSATHTLTPADAAKLPALLRNVAPGSRIRLKPGVYRYSRALTLNSQSRLLIEGIGQGDVRIELTDPYQDVFAIRHSSHITIRNIKARHSVKNVPCKGSVFSVRRSHNILLEKNEINGSGSIGVYAVYARNLTVRNNHVHKNSFAGFYVSRSRGVKILRNLVEKNGTAIKTYRSDVTLNHNTFRNNGR